MSLAIPLQWRHNESDGVSNHQPHDRLLNRFFSRGTKKTSKLRVTGLCAANSPVTGEFPAQNASNAENVSNWWRYHAHNQRTHDWIYEALVTIRIYIILNKLQQQSYISDYIIVALSEFQSAVISIILD